MFDKRWQVGHHQRRMRFRCGTKIRIHSDMNFHGVVFKPGTAAFGKIRRFGLFRNSKDCVIERACLIFTSDRDGELNMV